MTRQSEKSSIERSSKLSVKVRRWSRIIHRDLSFLLSGTLLIYCLSGIYMNHRDTINPHYSVERITFQNRAYSAQHTLGEAEVKQILATYNLNEQYTKHYYPEPGHLKVFIKGGSILELNQVEGEGVLELLKKRHLVSETVKLHYNPSRWWTYFSDIFCMAMFLIVVTGFTMMAKGKGFMGRGGILFLVGILFPILILFLL